MYKLAFFLVFFVALASPAMACLPPPPGTVEPPPPTDEQGAKAISDWSANILYGVVTRGSWEGKTPLFKIIHVYRGSLKPGQVIKAEHGWGFDPPPCMISSPPPIDKGEYGVIAFEEEPELNFIGDERLEAMFTAGYIKRASKP